LSGAPITFTQADVDNGLITYVSKTSAVVADSFTFSMANPLGDVISNQHFAISLGTVKAASAIDDSNGVNSFILLTNGTVFHNVDGSTKAVTSTKSTAISAGTDTHGNADVTVEYASDHSLWTHTGSVETTGWTKLNTAASIASLIPKMFVAGLDGIVDVVFTNNQLWQINLAHVGSPTLIAGNVNFVALGEHVVSGKAVPASFVAFLDSGATNGGVKEFYNSGGVMQKVVVTTQDAYAISASLTAPDMADLMLSNRGNSSIVDHADYAWRGVANSIAPITAIAVSSISIDASGDDFYVVQSTGSLYERTISNPTHPTALVTSPPLGVTAVIMPDGQTDAIDFLFANDTLWQISGLDGPNLSYTPLAE
jgi:hypothetical protein